MRLLTASAGVSVLVLTTLLPGVAEAAAPDNDSWSSAVQVSSVPFTASADTSEATKDADGPSDACYNSKQHSVWYRFTADQAQQVILTTRGSDFNNVLNLYSAKSADQQPSGWKLTSCDHGRTDHVSAVSLTPNPDRVYYLMVSSYRGSDGGNLQLTVRRPASLTSFRARRWISDPVDGSAVMVGRVACSLPAKARFYVTLRQRSGKAVAIGDGFRRVACGPKPSRMHLRIQPWSGWAFHHGRARADIRVAIYDEGTFVGSSARSRVLVHVR